MSTERVPNLDRYSATSSHSLTRSVASTISCQLQMLAIQAALRTSHLQTASLWRSRHHSMELMYHRIHHRRHSMLAACVLLVTRPSADRHRHSPYSLEHAC